MVKDTIERKQAEEEDRKLLHDVTERVKELNCLYGVSKLIAESEKSIDEIFQETVDLIPPSWQYPEITCARIVYRGREFVTGNFKETRWKQSTDIVASGEKASSVEVYYLKEKPVIDEGPFLKEERNLIDALGGLLRNIIERKQAEEELLLLQKINNMLNAGVDPEEVFKTIVDSLRSLYNYESVAIHLLSKDRKHLTVDGYSSDSKVAKKIEKLTGLTVMGYKVYLYEGSMFQEVVETGKPVITDDVSWVLKSYAGRETHQSMIKIAAALTKAKWGIGVPLLAGNKVVGVIGCGSVERLTDEDTQRFANFGAQAGLAIEKAQTYDRLESAYDRLKKSNHLKDLFIDIMTHDLLNPAGVTRNMTQMILEDEKDADKKEPLKLILRSSKRIIEMIENASIIAKLESGEETQFKIIDLCDILKEAVTEMTPLASEKKMKIKMAADGEFKALVNPLIHNVFSNLISNGIKYGSENSDIVLQIKEEGSNWKISVADNGPGIPDKDKEAIFDRFKRIQKGAVRGSGLGLAIVKKIVEAHKGKVWVEDTPGGGSIFFVLLKKA